MVLQSLQGLPGPQIMTPFCDASETMTVGELVASGRGADDARAAAPALPGDATGGAAQAITAMHAITNEAGRSNRAGISRSEL